MGDKDRNAGNDIIVSAEDAPEIIGDDQLEDVDGGGWSLQRTRFTSISPAGPDIVQPNAETIYGGAGSDDLIDITSIVSRRKLPDPYGF